MKLIDKDRLISELASRSYSRKSLELINSQPVVDAVPVYWLIKEYLTGSSRAGCQPRYETVKEILKEWGHTHADKLKIDTDKTYYGFDWEKENDKDSE